MSSYMGGYTRAQFEKGLQQGIQQGIEQAKQQILPRQVKALLNAGVSAELISNALNLSLDEIKKMEASAESAS